MELRHLRYFVAVAEELHFGRAARRLHISQPPLSAQIRDLEREVGAELLRRERRSVSLTAAGAAMLTRARLLLAGAEAMKREACGIGAGELGSLTIGYTTTAIYELLPRAVGLLRRRHAHVDLRLLELPSHEQGAALRAERIDIGLACLPAADLDGLTVSVAAHDTLVVAVPSRHALARRKTLRLRDLRDEALVSVRPTAEPGWAQACQAALTGAGVFSPIAQEADTKLAMLGLVAAGLGIAVVSSSLATLRRPGVVYVPLRDARTRLALGIVVRRERSALIERGLECLREAARDGAPSQRA